MGGVVVGTGMLWYYVSDRQERLAVPEDQMLSLAGSGILRPTTLVWRKGMAEWVSAGELKPELFQSGTAGAIEAGGVAVGEDRGLVMELARTLRTYAGWVEVSGWVHGLTGVACVAVGTAMAYFAWLRPERLVEWSHRAPGTLHPLLAHPWWTAGSLAAVALVLFFMGGQLIGGAARVRRAEQLHSREELRIALRSMGSFFRSTVLTLFLGLLLVTAGVLHHYRPWRKMDGPAPASTPANPPAPVKERVTI